MGCRVNEWAGTSWGGTVVATQAPAGPSRGTGMAAKAATGWEPTWNGLNVPSDSLRSRNPLRAMRDAQALYWTHPWVGGAEDTVTRKVVGLPWHLEDGDEDTVDDQERSPQLKEIRRLIEKPQDALPPEDRQVGCGTWRGMESLISRHAGLCGVSYLFKDQVNTLGQPAALLYVNPARLFPVVHPRTGGLRGYVLDPQDSEGRGGTPIRRELIIPFYLRPPDWGALPKGLVERAMLKARLSTMTDQHTAFVLGTGGRIPGLVAPKDGYIDNAEVYDQLVRDIRISSEAPDAATRTTVLRGPIEFFNTAGDLDDLELPEFARLTRDDIYTIWGIYPTQGAIQAPGGMNSGETRHYEHEQLMTGSVHDRVEMIRETLQLQLLDLYESAPQLVIEEPDFDDKATPYEIAANAKDQPLTVNERRALLNLDPMPDYGPDGEPLGLAIILPTTLTTFGQGPEEGGSDQNPFPKAPQPKPEPVRVLPPEQMPAVTGAAPAVPQPPEPAKAGMSDVRRTLDRFVPAMQRSVSGALDEQRRSVVAKFRARGEAIRKRPSSAKALWDVPAENARMAKAIEPHALGIGVVVTVRTRNILGKADPFEERVEQELRTRTARRIVGINETTMAAIVDAIRDAFGDGDTVDQVAARLESLPAFDAARAELVARTESAYAYNAAAISSYREFNVTEVEVVDGDEDDICAPVNGQTWTLEQAEADPIGHPNCTRDFIPVVGGL